MKNPGSCKGLNSKHMLSEDGQGTRGKSTVFRRQAVLGFCAGCIGSGLALNWIGVMERDFEPLKARLREICDRLDAEEQAYFRPLIDKFSGATSEFQRIMRDLGKFGPKISDGSKFEVYRQVQHLFDDAFRKK